MNIIIDRSVGTSVALHADEFIDSPRTIVKMECLYHGFTSAILDRRSISFKIRNGGVLQLARAFLGD